MSNSLQPCRLWPARLLCRGAGGFCRQEYWSILANTGCHSLLEHYISCCPSCQPPQSTWCCQNPCKPSSCTTSTPGPHRGRPKSSRAALGAIPKGQPTCRGGNKTTSKNQGHCGWRKRLKPSQQLYKLQIKRTQSTRQTLCLWNI